MTSLKSGGKLIQMSKNFKILKNYISKKMSMAHIYQPLMLIELIRGNGKKYLFCNSKDIKTIKDLRKYVNSIDWHTIESILVQ